MESTDEQGQNLRYYYRLEKIIHKPDTEDIISTIDEFKEFDLHLSRIIATKAFLENIIFLEGKYSPASYNSYDIKRGTGFNFSLLLLDDLNKEVYLVESTMTGIKDAVDAQKKEEREIFREAGFTFPIFKFSHLN